MKIQLGYPPEYVFKYKGYIHGPAEKIVDEQHADFIGDHVDYTKGKGIFMYYNNIPYPRKGQPFPEAIYAVNILKRFLVNSIRLGASKQMILPLIGFALMPNKKRFIDHTLAAFNDTCSTFLNDFYMDDYYCPTARQVQRFVKAFLASLGATPNVAEMAAESISMVVEWDNAYRFRFQDLMNETTKERLASNFPKEAMRLIKLNQFRDKNSAVISKMDKVGTLIRMTWWLPSIRKAIRAGLEAVNFEEWQLDEGDVYHTLLREDYSVRGIDINTRIGMLYALHNGHPPQLVPFHKIIN